MQQDKYILITPRQQRDGYMLHGNNSLNPVRRRGAPVSLEQRSYKIIRQEKSGNFVVENPEYTGTKKTP